MTAEYRCGKRRRMCGRFWLEVDGALLRSQGGFKKWRKRRVRVLRRRMERLGLVRNDERRTMNDERGGR